MKAKVFGLACWLLCAFSMLGCGQSDEVKRERFSGKEEVVMYQAALNILRFLPADFDYESMVLYQDEESGIVGLARKGQRGFSIGNSVNTNLMTTCPFYEAVEIVDNDIRFTSTSCGASGKLNGADLILSGMDDCGFCGMGASLNGAFTRFAEIVFEYAGGKPTVKQVYKLS